MVASKGRTAGGFRILDESKASKKESDFKGHLPECRRAMSFASISKLPRDGAGRVSLLRKPVLSQASANTITQSDLKNEMETTKNGRKALADIGNLNNSRSQKYTDQMNINAKQISKYKLVGVKKAMLEGSNISKGFLMARNTMISSVPSTKSTGGNPKSFVKISVRPKLPTRRRTVCETHILKENQIELPNIGPKMRISLAKGIMIAGASSTNFMRENPQNSMQNSLRPRIPMRRKTVCETNASKGDLNEVPHTCSRPSKIQIQKLPKTSFVAETLKATKNVITTIESTMGNPKSSAQISLRSGIHMRRRAICKIHVSEDQKEILDFCAKPSKVQAKKLPKTRFAAGTSKLTKNVVTARELAEKSIRLQKPAIARMKKRYSEGTKKKKLEEAGASNNHENAKISKNDIESKASLPGHNSNRRKSFTLSLMKRGCLGRNLLPKIDDINNPLEVADYVDDIYQYYWRMEAERPDLGNFMDIQSNVTPKMRSILINWLIEVHDKYRLMEESLFLMIELLDRLLSVSIIEKDEFQLQGLTTLLLASKYEDYWHPKVDELISLAANQYTKDEMLDMEILILKKLLFRLNVPTPFVFMLRFLKASRQSADDQKVPHKEMILYRVLYNMYAYIRYQVEDLAFYLLELCLVEKESLKYKPSILSASAIFLARSSLGLSPAWTDLLVKHTHYKELQIRICAEMMLGFQKAASSAKYTHHKYSKIERNCAALITPIDSLPFSSQ